MSEPSTASLKKHIRSIVAKAKGEPVGLKTLLKTLETDLGLEKGALTPRKNEVRDLLVAVMEEDVESDDSTDEEVIPSRSSKQQQKQQEAEDEPVQRGRAPSGAPGRVEPAQSSEIAVEDDEANDKTAGKSRAGQTPDFSGFLKKRGDQGRLKLWRKRHFRLYKKEGVVAYFKSEKESEQLGEISVAGAFLIDKREDLGKLVFTITMKTTARVWILQAPDEGTMSQWLDMCKPLMKQSAAVRTVGGQKPPKPANGLPLSFPPTYVQGFAEREQCVSRLQSGELDWTKLSRRDVKPVQLAPGQVSLSFHGCALALVEEVRAVDVNAQGEAYINEVPKQLKYSAESVVWSAPNSTLLQHRFQMDEKTQRDLLKKLVGRRLIASVPGNAAGHGEDEGKRSETRLNPAPAPAGHAHGAPFPADVKFEGKLYYDQKDDRYSLVDDSSNTVHFLDTRDARTIKATDADLKKLNHGTEETFIAPRLWAKFDGSKGAKTQGLLTYRIHEGFEFHTNYVLLLSADETSADIEGLFSIHNKTSKTFEQALIKVVPNPKEEEEKKKKDLDPVAEAAKEAAKEEATKKVGGGLMALAGAFLKKDEDVKPPPPKVYEYAAPHPATLPAYDWAHVSFVSKKIPVKVQHLITFTTPKYAIKPVVSKEAGTDATSQVFTVARFTNPTSEPLPPGKAQVNRLELSGLGATQVADCDLPRVEGGETVILQLEALQGVSATRVQTGFNFDGEKHFIIETFEITVSNGRQETVNITVEDSLFRWSNFEISASKPQHRTTEHPRRIAWDLRLNHGEYQTIKYTSFSQSFELESDYQQ